MRENAGKMPTRITPNTYTFYASCGQFSSQKFSFMARKSNLQSRAEHFFRKTLM